MGGSVVVDIDRPGREINLGSPLRRINFGRPRSTYIGCEDRMR